MHPGATKYTTLLEQNHPGHHVFHFVRCPSSSAFLLPELAHSFLPSFASAPDPDALSQSADGAYASKSYELAHELYSEAIGMADRQDTETKARLLANRAATLMNLGRNESAIRDCAEVSFCFETQPIGSRINVF